MLFVLLICEVGSVCVNIFSAEFRGCCFLYLGGYLYFFLAFALYFSIDTYFLDSMNLYFRGLSRGGGHCPLCFCRSLRYMYCNVWFTA